MIKILLLNSSGLLPTASYRLCAPNCSLRFQPHTFDARICDHIIIDLQEQALYIAKLATESHSEILHYSSWWALSAFPHAFFLAKFYAPFLTCACPHVYCSHIQVSLNFLSESALSILISCRLILRASANTFCFKINANCAIYPQFSTLFWDIVLLFMFVLILWNNGLHSSIVRNSTSNFLLVFVFLLCERCYIFCCS
jgi:hypothetical protein